MVKNDKKNLIFNNITEFIGALDISLNSSIPLKELLEKIISLLNSDLSQNNTEIVIETTSDNYTLINLEQGMLPFLICKLLIFSIEDSNNKKISVLEYTENNKVIIEFNMPSSPSTTKIRELKEIARLLDNTQISVEFSNVVYLNKSQKSENLSCTISLSIAVENLSSSVSL